MSASSPDREWARLTSLVDALLDVPAPERAARIAELAAGDPARHAELERLLAECEREITLLERPAAERFASLLDETSPRFPEALAARYRMIREIGRGGMATVWLAHDMKHHRDVAIKVVHPSVAAALGAERFLREIAIVAQLRHPHIVPLFDSGDAGGALYYVMPYEPGASLRDRLARDGPLPIGEAVAILRDVCDALAHAHAAGVVHRDVKPDNVLLSGRHALVTDFGIASSRTEATAHGMAVVLGTPAYMSPEQVTGEREIDGRADLYAVGALAYELLTGRPPFVGDRDAVLDAQRRARPADVATLRGDAPPALAALVMRCLEKRPDDRWPSADELMRRLDGLASASAEAAPAARRTRWVIGAGIAGAVVVALALAFVVRPRATSPTAAWRARWAAARVERVTDFPGSEVDATISPGGGRVAFLADRDGPFDAFVTHVGGEAFTNVTGGRLAQLYNEDVRNVGFTPDSTDLWIRVADIASPASVSLVSARGGAARPFLPTAVMIVWSPDGSRLAYHQTVPGDPIWIADARGNHARRLFAAEPGVHCHHLAWSPDGRFLYFTMGLPPDEMDVWRIAVSGGAPERMTRHQSRVSSPALLDDRTLVYSATADDGTGPWLYTMDVDERVAQRVSTGVEHYLSVAASAATPNVPRRLVATVSNPSTQLWSVRIGDGVVAEGDARAMQLPTARAAAPRFVNDSTLLYLASRGGADGVWRLTGVNAAEEWKPGGGTVTGPAVPSPDGTGVCFVERRELRSTLRCATSDLRSPRALAASLDVRGAPSWSPDGRWLAIAARVGSGTRVFKVPVDGGAPVQLVDSVSSNPVWSPGGTFILYSGTPRARSVPVHAVAPDGRPYPFPDLTVDRVGDSYRFMPGGTQLVVKRGGFRQQDFWLLDVATGATRRLTSLTPGQSLQRFDVSPDGRRIVFERVRENSDVVLIELPAPAS